MRSTAPSRYTFGMQKSSNPWLTASRGLDLADHASAVGDISYGCAAICRQDLTSCRKSDNIGGLSKAFGKLGASRTDDGGKSLGSAAS